MAQRIGGGSVVLSCDGTITLSNTLVIATNTFGGGNYSEIYLPTAASGSQFYRTVQP
jgi:hypothetical protein